MANFLKPLARIPNHSKFNYVPRYQKKVNRLEERKSEIKLERGSFYKHSKTFSNLRGPSITHYKHNTQSRKNAKYIVLLSMMACVYSIFVLGGKVGLFAISGLFILLIVFLRLNNKS